MRDPKRYTLGTAAKATGKSKTTIQRAISKGQISAERLGSGGYSIDPSELHRVFPMVGVETVSCDPKMDTLRPIDEILMLREKLAISQAMLAREREALTELRQERDAWKQQATALLAAPSQPRRWWPWNKK
jgi:excisionase family DNA binding protein